MKPKLNKMAYFSFFVAVFCFSVALIAKDDPIRMLNGILSIFNLSIFVAHPIIWREQVDEYNLTHSKDIDDKQIS